MCEYTFVNLCVMYEQGWNRVEKPRTLLPTFFHQGWDMFLYYFTEIHVKESPQFHLMKLKKMKLNKALDENLSLSYGTSPAMWDHTVLPATRHKWTRPALTPGGNLVLNLPIPWRDEG